MRSVYEEKIAEAIKVERAIVQGTARLCSSNFGKVCKALWPLKTAEHLAAAVGCSVRAAAYEISGDRDPSAQSILAVVDAITPKIKRKELLSGSAGQGMDERTARARSGTSGRREE